METLFSYVAPPSRCGYLPDQTWSLEYEMVGAASAADYMAKLKAGWRRFGTMFFRPRCPTCRACQSLRVVVDQFRPDRSQKRAVRTNAGQVDIEIGPPSVDGAKLKLYDRYHAFQVAAKGWPEHPAKDAASYHQSFVDNPFPTEEWRYFVNDKLVGVGYVDNLPEGMSAIYFFYDPDESQRSLGTFNVMCLLEEAAARGMPYLYLGYHVADCPSLAYKCRFAPNQVLGPDGVWHDFRK